MKRRRFILFNGLPAAMMLELITSSAIAQLRVVDYNIARLGGDLQALEAVLAALNEDDVPGFAVAPHVYAFQEVRSEDAAPLHAILNAAVPPGVSYALATYTSSVFEDGSGGAQAMFYRPDVLVEIASAHDDIATGAGRNTDRWKLALIGYDSPDAAFVIYSSHLRAGDEPDDMADRLAGVMAIRANADALGPDQHIIFTGDYNFSSHLEPGYEAFFDAGNALAVDPLGTGSWTGPGGAMTHTQSPRLVSSEDLIGGGLDDRFDLQLSTIAWHDDDGLAILAGTYRALGNDGAHYNASINAGNNFYYPGEIVRSNALADALHEASDHLPVVVEYQLPAVMVASLPSDFGRVIEGAVFAVPLLVSNDAVVAHPAGADVLDFVVEADGALSGSFAGSAGALDGPAQLMLPVNTSSIGIATGSALVMATSEAAQPALVEANTGGIIIDPANASFSSAMDVNVTTIAASFDADSGVQPLVVNVHNLNHDPFQALLDVDEVLGVRSPLALAAPLPMGIADEPGSIAFAFDTTGIAPGQYVFELAIAVSDEDLPGETPSSLNLTITIAIEGSSLLGDVNGDDHVNAADLALLLGAWGANPGHAADLTGDGAVNAADLALLLGAWTG